MAKTMHEEYELRIKPLINISYKGIEHNEFLRWIFRWNIQNKGFYPVKFLDYIMKVFLLRGSDERHVYSAGALHEVFIEPGEEYPIRDSHALEIRKLAREMEVGDRLQVRVKFTFLDCLKTN